MKFVKKGKDFMRRVQIQCPHCTKKSFIDFEETWMEDQAFRECLVEEPWVILCNPCEQWLIKLFPGEDPFEVIEDYLWGIGHYTGEFKMEERIKELKRYAPSRLLCVNQINQTTIILGSINQ